jgi:hypothetical protein
VNTTTAVIIIVVFLALDIVFYFLIIRSMEHPTPSAALARARDLSIIPDSEGESVGLRLRQHLPLPKGDLFDIVRLVLPGGEGYLFTTQPQADSHLPKTAENRRQFIAVLIKTPADGGLFIHPPVRFPCAGFKRRRLFRVSKTGAFFPVSADRLPPSLTGGWRVRAEHERFDPESFFTREVTDVMTNRAPRSRGFALVICPGGLAVYINPLLKNQVEAGRFCDFTRELVEAIMKKTG